MGLLSRLFNKTPGWVRKVAASEGLYVATDEEVYGVATGLKVASDAKKKTAESLVEWAKDAERLIEAGAVLPWGVPLGAVIGKWASKPETLAFEERREDHVKPFAQAYAAHPMPLTAVMLSEACFDAALDARGTDWAHKVSEKNWEIYAKWNRRGEEALLAEAEAGATSLPWLAQAYSGVTNSPQDAEQLQAAFTRTMDVEPGNLHLLREHGMYLLPRWFGKDYGTIELFARSATEATSEQFGAGAYAYIYGQCANIGELAASDTECDAALLDQGYQDLRERFPSVRLHNEHANAMSWIGAESRVLEIFAEGLKAIDTQAWGGDNTAEGLEYAAYAFAYARDNA